MRKIYSFLELPPFEFDTLMEEPVKIPLQEGWKERLQEFFYPFNKELARLLNRDLDWKV